MKEELRMEFSRLMKSEDLLTMIESHKVIADVGFYILFHHNKEAVKTSWDHDANLLYQMTILKSISLLQHSNPIDFVNNIDGSFLKKTFDPFSMFNIVRAQYEAFCNFNNIYIQSKTLEELKLKYFLWVLSGLNYRQRFGATSDFAKEKKLKEANEIADLMKAVTSNTCFVQLEEQSQKNILEGIKKRDWQFKIDGIKASKIAWHEMMTNAGTNEMLDGQYSSLSLNTHPSNVSVFQFGSMYTDGMQEFNSRMAIQLSKIFTALLIRDYIFYFNSCKELFNKTPQMSQMLINSCNKMFRNEEFKLNDINDMLN